MAYVDHAFSISDEDIMMETSYVVQNRPPIREIGLAVSLLVFRTLGIVIGIFMAANKVGGDRAHATARNHYTMQETKYQLHAQAIACSLDLLKYDGIVCVSGDSVFVEVMKLGTKPDIFYPEEAVKRFQASDKYLHGAEQQRRRCPFKG